MTNELREHLIRCENAMQLAKPILGKHSFHTDNRTLTVIGFISILVELQESILLLVTQDMAGSASALLRSVVESAYRALWINHPATDEEVKRFNEKDRIELRFGEIAATLDNAYSTGDFFQNFKARAWKHLNSYTHGGMHQIGRRFINHEVANNYSDEQICETTTIATTLALLSILIFLNKRGYPESGDQIQSLMETYGPVKDMQFNAL